MWSEMLEGKMIVSNLRPQCKELWNWELSHWDMVQVVRYTRQDDSKSEHWDKRVKEKGEKWEKGDKVQQMFYDIETLIVGTMLEGEIIVDSDNSIEIWALYSALLELKNKPYIWGASRVGHGKIEILNDIDFDLAKEYDNYVLEHKEEIIEWIQTQ
jgi:CRISPR/Cas system CSM-associated protein Csm3 (group 7 of RAMP superfamily)